MESGFLCNFPSGEEKEKDRLGNFPPDILELVLYFALMNIRLYPYCIQHCLTAEQEFRTIKPYTLDGYVSSTPSTKKKKKKKSSLLMWEC
jgi:hypothetical protein